MLEKLNLLSINKLNALKKLRIIIGLIFTFSTLSIILVFVNIMITAILILISYLLLLILTIKLFMIKKL
jgi:hypothetical protein